METYKMKLGKKAPINKLSVAFGDFITVYPTAPLVDFAPDYVYPMDLNDQYGVCVVAGFDHSIQIITGLLNGTQKNFTTAEIETFYKTQNPNFPQDDNGMSIQLFLEYLATNKYILGFAKIDHNNAAQMKAAIYLGLSIMTGVALQEAQRTQFPSSVWDFVAGSPIVGGHCINGAGYNVGIMDVVSWGKLISATDNFVSQQMDEAWFILTQDHVDHPSFRNHFDLAGFSQAVSQITGGKVIIPVPTPLVYPVLRIGSTGSFVKILQTDLNKFLGSPNNPTPLIVDGQFGAITWAAVKAFQSKNNLVNDGIVGKMTWSALNGTPTPVVTSKIDKWCAAAKQMEGALPSRNNPGNLRFVGQQFAVNDNGFCKFDTYQHGYDALRTLLVNACSGLSHLYNANGTLYDFYNVYAPSSDGNNPKHYAEFVANYIGVSPLVIIKTLLI